MTDPLDYYDEENVWLYRCPCSVACDTALDPPALRIQCVSTVFGAGPVTRSGSKYDSDIEALTPHDSGFARPDQLNVALGTPIRMRTGGTSFSVTLRNLVSSYIELHKVYDLICLKTLCFLVGGTTTDSLHLSADVGQLGQRFGITRRRRWQEANSQQPSEV